MPKDIAEMLGLKSTPSLLLSKMVITAEVNRPVTVEVTYLAMKTEEGGVAQVLEHYNLSKE
jgi:hypothetical protein